jgi:hypothetical protein
VIFAKAVVGSEAFDEDMTLRIMQTGVRRHLKWK